MSASGAATRSRPIRPVGIALTLVIAAIGLSPIATVAYQLYWPRTWEGDVPAVVSHVSGSYFTGSWVVDFYSVELPGTLPEDALDSDLDYSYVVSEMLEGVTNGEPVTCHVEQTFIGGRDMAIGPRTNLTHCWR